MILQKKPSPKNDLAYYDLNADKWWKEDEILYLLSHFNRSRFEFASRYISNWQNVKVLDIGCGGGLACEFLANQGADVSGLDLSFNSIKVAQNHARENNVHIDYRQGNAEDLPYSDRSFDVVVCFDVLEHVSDLNRVISEAYRVLDQDGIFLFDTINRTFKSRFVMIWLLENILGQIPRGLHDWKKFIKPDELVEIMQTIGFSDIVIKGFDVTDGTNFEVLKKIISEGLNSHKKSKALELFNIQINDDISMCYIGKASKLKP